MKIIRNYIFWAYERGSFHYDIMVTAILLFIFVAPRFIDFKDKPIRNVPLHPSEILVKSRSLTGDAVLLTYEVRADDLGPVANDTEVRTAILRAIEPISGDVELEGYQPVLDTKGKITAYDATVRR